MGWDVVKRLVAVLLLPPAGPLLLALLGAWMSGRAGRMHRAGRLFLWFGLAAAWALSTSFVAEALVLWVETGEQALTEERLRQELRGPNPPGAIVVLGGGIRYNLHEQPQAQTPNELTLHRLAHGAMLARRTGLPVLLSGGAPPPRVESEARTMARTLESSFGLRARWLEENSADTAGNARESARILRAAGVRRVVLVTQAYHMRRARPSFEAAGLEVLAAPNGFWGNTHVESWASFVPTSGAVRLSWLATHEAIGLLWYRLSDYL